VAKERQNFLDKMEADILRIYCGFNFRIMKVKIIDFFYTT